MSPQGADTIKYKALNGVPGNDSFLFQDVPRGIAGTGTIADCAGPLNVTGDAARDIVIVA